MNTSVYEYVKKGFHEYKAVYEGIRRSRHGKNTFNKVSKQQM